jgi:hypothetical protein
MSALGDSFRERAGEQHAAALAILETATFPTDPKAQVTFVVGKVTANVLQLLGETVDVLEGTATLDNLSARRAKILEKTNGIRDAAATGEWDEFDRLVRELGRGGHTAGD